MNTKAPDRILNNFTKICLDHGLKITPQRTVIYEELLKSRDHPTIDSLVKRVRKILPHVSFDTVYRTVLCFSDLGLVKEVEGYSGVRRYDPVTENHHHFRCTRCHRIIDFKNAYFDSIKVPGEILKQFVVTDKKIVLEGLCDECNKKT